MVRVNELVRREIGTALYRVVTGEQIDLSVVTITRVITSPTFRDARVSVSVRGDDALRERVLKLLRRHRGELQETIAKNLGFKYTPKLHFEADLSIEKGDHILDILHGMDGDVPGAGGGEGGEPA